MQTDLHELLRKEVSRQEFLRTVGIGVVSLLGLSSLLKLAGHKSHSTRGYGASPYGR
ncbi:MAG TPA: hypothetical protein VHD84_00140 [Candidatus Saccharimonadales bacterium]|nr:hypothetical protein [Candidatus Saccharimonadales bacterium]